MISGEGTWRLALTALAALGAALWLLDRLNLPRAMRHRQRWAPVAALGTTAAAVYAYLRIYPAVAGAVEEALEPVLAGLADLLGASGWQLAEAVHVVLNLGLLLGFVALKTLGNGGARLLARLTRGRASERRLLVHRPTPDGVIYLRDEWVQPGMLLRRLGLLAALPLFVLLILDATLLPLPLAGTWLPAPALLLLLEAGWFLDGLRPDDAAERFGGSDVAAEPAVDYAALWEQYRTLWPDQVLAAAAHVDVPRAAASPVAYRRTPDPDPVTEELERVWNDVLSRGAALEPVHYELLADLRRGRDVLVSSAVYADLGPILFAALHLHLVDGRRVLVLVEPDRRDAPGRHAEVADWLRAGLADHFGGELTWEVETLEAFRQQHQTPHVLVASAAEVLATGATGEAWFDEVRVVLALNAGATVMNRLPAVRALLQRLRARVQALQVVAVAEGRHGLESGLRGFLTGNFREHRLAGPVPDAAFVLVWRLEGRLPFEHAAVQAGLLSGAPDALGAEAVLALPAWERGARALLALGQEEQPWDEYAEELAKDDALRAHGFTEGDLGPSRIAWLAPPARRAVLLVRDRRHNLVAALRDYLPLGRRLALVHVVAPPYLLRDYFAENIEFFLATPLFAQPLTPRLAATSRYAVAYGLLERLTAEPVEAERVFDELRRVWPGAATPEDALCALFQFLFDIDLRARGYLRTTRRTVYDRSAHAFTEQVLLSLDPHLKEHEQFAWLRRFRIVDDGGHVQGYVTADHLYQTYLPGQVHTLRTQDDGQYEDKPFEIVAVDPQTATVRTRHRPARRHIAYRPDLTITVDGVHHWQPPDVLQRSGTVVARRLGKARFRVSTHGYWRFGSDLSLDPAAHTYVEMRDVPERSYRAGRLLHLCISPAAPLPPAEREAAARTLAALCREAFVTLFPETHMLLHVCSTPDTYPAPGLDHVVPRLDAEGLDDGADDALHLYFIEDSHADAGLVQAVYAEWAYVLEVLADVLDWLLDPQPKPDLGWHKQVGDRTAFLCYGQDALPETLDLQAAQTVLAALGLSDVQLGAQRRAFYERPRPDVTAREAAPCDFCGRPTPVAQRTRLADGRERCATCSAQAVDTQDDLRAVYDEARRFLVGRYDLALTRDIEVRFADPHAIAAVQGSRFLPTADFDEQAVGLAVRSGEGRYSVLVENGQPYHLTLETLAHELTHIWQYTSLDVDRLYAEHGLLLIEGHALWAGLRCLEDAGLAPEHVARQAARNDVYGAGYRFLQEQLRETGTSSPFTFLRERYPR